jgi:hypothetical protein
LEKTIKQQQIKKRGISDGFVDYKILIPNKMAIHDNK